jgi:2-polyprenyl-3-methyl-5-hydroxy-6-metoxy-1,4-benzoquinol methylase
LGQQFRKKNVDDEKVKDYFDKIADEFDSIYENKGTLLSRITNKFFRKGMFERVPITVQESRPLQDKSVLDIGCGSGRVSFLLAKEGARVTGIDYARSMIELAKKYQQQLKVIDNVEFICSDFMSNFPEDKKYDISIAIGVFDYIKDPMPFLKKVKKMTTTKIIAYYPAKFAFQSPLRKVWLSTRNCPVFFYTEGELKKIYSDLGIEKTKIIPVPQGALLPDGYIVTSQVN